MQLTSTKKIIFLLASLLAIAAAVYAAQWKWHFWHPGTTQNQDIEVNDSTLNEGLEPDIAAPEMPDNNANIREVLSAHLFGQETVTAKAVNSSTAVPKTQQPVELHGIVFIPQHPERRLALIAQAGGIAKDYKTGDELMPMLPGWKVHSIAPTSVQIEHEGTVELLELAQKAALLNNPNAVITPASSVNAMPQDNGMTAPTDEIPPVTEEMPQPEEPAAQDTPPPPDEIPAFDGGSAPPLEGLPAPESAPTSAIEPAKTAQELGLKEATDLTWDSVART